jgi:hypothetical protein
MICQVSIKLLNLPNSYEVGAGISLLLLDNTFLGFALRPFENLGNVPANRKKEKRIVHTFIVYKKVLQIQ